MASALRKHWPLVAALALLCLALAGVVGASWRLNGGLVYALDDSYIHMAMAKNVVRHGVFGVTSHEFSSSSSSLLWTLLLAAVYAVIGVSETAPLVLNAVFALLTLVCAYAFVRQGERRYGGPYLLLALLAIAFITPLPALVMAGMEHTLHALVTLVFAGLGARVLADDAFAWRKRPSVLVLVLAPLVTTARYEGLFLVFVVCCLLLLRGRIAYAVAVGAAALLPLVLYGAYSASQGWYWLPNSLLLKGRAVWKIRSLMGLLVFLKGGYGRFYTAYQLAVPVLVAMAGYVLRSGRRVRLWDPAQTVVVVFVLTTALHVLFAGLGWFYRYEAYLVALGLFAVAWVYWELLPEAGPRPRLDRAAATHGVALAALAIALTLPVVGRAVRSLHEAPQATRVRRLHHFNAARFVARYYDGEPVVVNDVGAMAFYTDARLIDLYGLASIKALRLRKGPSNLSPDDVAAWAADEHARIAIVTGNFAPIDNRIPPGWVKVAEWRAPPSVVWTPAEGEQAGPSTWWVYAVEPSHSAELAAHLREFARDLPSGVEQVMVADRPTG